MSIKKIKLGNYIELLTDYHSGGSYQSLKENTKILYEPDYAVMIRTINFERNTFDNELIYCDKNTYDFLSYCHVKENDILMNKIANPGNVYCMPKVDYKVACGMNLFLIRLKNINQKYMYYVMQANEKYIKSFAHGTTTKTITKDQVRNLKFNIDTDVNNQEKIANLLSNLDELIYGYQKNIRDSLNFINKVYSYWFLQYNFPNENGKPYSDNGGELIFNELLKRNVPTGWKVENFKTNSLSKLVRSGVEHFEKKNYIATANIKYNQITDGDWITFENRESRANMQPKINTIWFAKMKNSIKHLVLTEDDLWFTEKYILSTGFYGLECKNFALAYMFSTINYPYFEEVKNKLAHGATQEAVNDNDLKSIKLVIPPKNILEKYNTFILPVIKFLNESIKNMKEAEEHKNKIMPYLILGKIK